MAQSITGNCGLAGATVYWTGNPAAGGAVVTGTATADGSGNYTTGTTLVNGVYWIVAYSPGNTFSPAYSIQTVSGANITGVNFTSTSVGQSGVWTRRGIVMVPNTSDLHGGTLTSGLQEPTVLYEANPHLISPNADGKVFKMWFAGAINVYYAESNDGLNWTRQAAASLTGVGNPRCYNNAGTYYIYGTTGFSGGSINRYTSADGTGFTQTESSVMVHGAAGTWDSAAIWDLHVFEIVAGVWHALYTGTSSNSQFDSGYATSTDGVTWTKSPSNPVLLNVFSPSIYKIGSTYYIWGTQSEYIGNAVQPFAIPSEGGFSTSTDLVNWTGSTNVFQRTLASEGVGGTRGQTGTYGSLVEVAGKTYWYYTTSSTGDDGLNFNIQCAVYNGPMSAVVASKQQVFVPGASTLAVRQTASGGGSGSSTTSSATAINVPTGDLIVAAVRAGAAGSTITGVTDTAGNTYTPLTAISNADFGPLQLFYAKNVTGNAANVVKATYGTAQTFAAIFVWDISGADTTNPLDMQTTGYSHPSVQLLSSSQFSTTSPNEIIVSMATSFNINDTYVAGTLGFPPQTLDATFPAGAGNLYCGAQHSIVQALQSNAVVNISNTGTANPMAMVVASFKAAAQPSVPSSLIISPSSGAQGTTLSVTITGSNFDSSGTSTISFSGSGITVNSYSVQNATTITASITISGSAAVANYDVSVTNINGLSGTLVGGFSVTAPVAGAYSVPDDRDYGNFPNLPVDVQGTETYTIPNPDSRVVIPVDDRTNKPVDSRTLPNIPENSRTNPPFED